MAMCEALVDGWHGNWTMSRAIAHAWRLTEKTPENETVKYHLAADAVKVKNIFSGDRVQVWIARNMRNLNESLWAGRKRDTCISCAQKTLGVRNRSTGTPLQISVRERDKQTDWKTVK